MKGTRNEHGLTPKQEAFALAYDRLGVLVDAYREAYPVAKNWSVDAAYVQASRMIKHPQIVLRVRGLMEARREKEQLTTDKLRAIAISTLVKEATEGTSPAAKVRAAELVGKLRGVAAFAPEEQEIKVEHGGLVQLDQRLSLLIGRLIAGPALPGQESAGADSLLIEDGAGGTKEAQGTLEGEPGDPPAPQEDP